MIQLASLGTLFCVVLAAGFLARIIHDWERPQRDDDGPHLLHGPNDGCLECEDK